jgi:hypothetical protein
VTSAETSSFSLPTFASPTGSERCRSRLSQINEGSPRNEAACSGVGGGAGTARSKPGEGCRVWEQSCLTLLSSNVEQIVEHSARRA